MSSRSVNRIAFGCFQFIIAVCFFTVLTSARAGESKPVAVTLSDAYDFGEVFEGPDAIHEYIIKNTGDANLEIKNVKAG
ncbi:MAG: hypothetical protein M0Z56_10635 [Desulfobacteraceae bacterium]|nr:hypothetical protein [Desulfobacteraceae bacterium]